MADYLQIAAAIVGVTETAIATNAVSAGCGGDGAVVGLQVLAGGAEAASVAFYFRSLQEDLAAFDENATSARLQIAASEGWRGDPLPVATAALMVLAAAVALVEAVLMLNGFGTPESGQRFTHGAAMFSVDITTLLGAATADAWDGGGAENYNSHNADQQAHVQQLAEADAAVAAALTNQARAVEEVRLQLAGITAGLAGSTIIAMGMFRQCLGWRNDALGLLGGERFLEQENRPAVDCWGVASDSWRIAWQWAIALFSFVSATVLTAVGGVMYLLYRLIDEVASRTRHHLHQARDSYRRISSAASTQPTGAAAGTPQTAVSGASHIAEFSTSTRDAPPGPALSGEAGNVLSDQLFQVGRPATIGPARLGRSPGSGPAAKASRRPPQPSAEQDAVAEEDFSASQPIPVEISPAAARIGRRG